MKKIFLVCILAFFAMSMLLFAGCEESEKKFTGITFEDDTVVYDGEQHSILIEGTLPDGADVSYTGNSGTDAGTYNATATISKEGYETLKMNATLTISKATFTGITFKTKLLYLTVKNTAFPYKATCLLVRACVMKTTIRLTAANIRSKPLSKTRTTTRWN